jgi:hypothetical protein
MPLVLEDRVRETTIVTGTNDATLLGAVTGFQAFSVIGNGNTTYYTISDQSGSNWEVGLGTFSSAGPTLARTTVLSSSAGGAKVSFPAGTKDVFITYPSEKAVYLDGSNNVQPNLGTATITTGVFSAGTVSAPAITTTGDTNTGIFFPAADTIAFTEGGVESGRFTSAGALQLNANLTFSGTGNRITGDFSNATVANRVAFQSSTTNGNINAGFLPNGTATQAVVRVYNNSDPTNAAGLDINANSTTASLNSIITGTGTYLPLTMFTGNSERLRIDTSGNVGIGTSSPVSKFQVAGTVTAPTYDIPSGSGYNSFQMGADGTGTWYVYDKTNAAYRLNISNAGNVGIGTSSPTALLQVNGTAKATSMSLNGVSIGDYNLYSGMVTRVVNGGGIGINSANSTDNAYIYFGSGTSSAAQQSAAIGRIGGDVLAMFTASAERMRITSTGNVGIGTSSPSGFLGNKLVIATGGTANEGMTIYSSSNNGSIWFADATTGNGRFAGGIDYQHSTNEMVFYFDNIGNARFLSGGVLLTGGKSSATANGGDVQVSKGITFPATQSAQTDANTLDDYEEGTWTPVLRGSATNGTYVYDTDRTGATYIKIGRQVTVRGVFSVSSITSAGTGDAYISGLPFSGTNPAPSWSRAPGNLMCQGGTTAMATTGIFCGFDTSGVTYFGIYTQSTTTQAAIPVTTADDVSSIWSFTYTYLTAN